MKTGIVKDSRYLEHRMGDFHPESPRRLEVIYKMLEEDKDLPPLILVAPRPAEENEICLIHTKSYFEAIKETAGRERVFLDPDTSTSSRSFEAARLAAGGLLEASGLVMKGELENGFALVRPPGHHAEASAAKGFCIFNNVAVAAQYLIQKHGLERILIVDWDLHHGNGTQNAFYSRQDVLYFSTHQFPHYPGSGFWNEVGNGRGEGFTVNVPLSVGKTDDDFLFIFRRLLYPIAKVYRPQFVLVSAGFDISAGDPLGGMEVTPRGFGALAAEMTRLAGEFSGRRLLLTLEGGYNLTELREGVKQVLLVLTGMAKPDVREPKITGAVEKELAPVFKVQKKFWPVEL